MNRPASSGSRKTYLGIRDTVLHQPAAERLIRLIRAAARVGPRRVSLPPRGGRRPPQGASGPMTAFIDPVRHGEPDDTREIGLIGEKHPFRGRAIPGSRAMTEKSLRHC